MFQKWFPLNCIKFSVVIIAAAAFISGYAKAAVLPAGKLPPKIPSATSPMLPPLLKEVENLYARSSTLTATFAQDNLNVALSMKKKSSGKIFVKRPAQIRWETTLPDVNYFICNGNRSWFYTPPFDPGERGQLIEKKTSEIQSRLTIALVSGSFSMAKDMTFTQKNSSTFVLTPKPGSAGTVLRATIAIDPSRKLIHQVILEHRGGNQTQIDLKDIVLGKPLPESLFSFNPPPNTDRVAD